MVPTAFTVTQLNQYIKQTLELDVLLSSVWVKGEISNFKHHTSGHMYLTLKDEGGVLKSVMFRSSAARLMFEPENGMKVLAHGRVSVFERDGQYQLYIDKMEPDGVGALHVAYEQLKQKLQQEGLFDQTYKKELPPFPKKIAVITSPTGAAVRDILNVLSRRYPLADVVICPVLVQGEGASKQIASAIEFVNDNELADVIITGRGGGSIEELWAFNEEETARAIFASRLPVISAVGHETDFTIADFVADYRAPTPSAAAEIAVPSLLDLKGYLSNCTSKMNFAAAKYLENKKNALEGLVNRLSFKSIRNNYDQKRILVDSLLREMEQQVQMVLSKSRERFSKTAATLHALSPLAVMTRGYSVAQNKDGKIIKQLADIAVDEFFTLRLSDGIVTGKAVKKEKIKP